MVLSVLLTLWSHLNHLQLSHAIYSIAIYFYLDYLTFFFIKYVMFSCLLYFNSKISINLLLVMHCCIFMTWWASYPGKTAQENLGFSLINTICPKNLLLDEMQLWPSSSAIDSVGKIGHFWLWFTIACLKQFPHQSDMEWLHSARNVPFGAFWGITPNWLSSDHNWGL